MFQFGRYPPFSFFLPSKTNKHENQDEDALGKIEQQQDFVTFLEPQL